MCSRYSQTLPLGALSFTTLVLFSLFNVFNVGSDARATDSCARQLPTA